MTGVGHENDERTISVELREAANLLHGSGDYDLRDACREAARRLKATTGVAERRAEPTLPTPPALGELIEALKSEACRNGGQGAYAWRARELCGKAADALERLLSQPRGEGLSAEADGAQAKAKMIAAFKGPVVSLEVREPYYLASCDACGWVGSSELCGTDSFGDDSDVYCPRCQSSGADCGEVAALIAL